MAWNDVENAFDIAGMGNNHWSYGDDGNWYSNYTGSGPYIIPANVGPGAYDYSPAKSLDLNTTFPVEYEITTTGNTMIFPAQARNPGTYEVYSNGSLLYSETWDGMDIVVDVDGLAAGIHEIMIRAFHISGHYMDAISYLTVYDITPPEWVTEPTDQEIYYHQPFSYQLNATDPSGVLGWSVNGSVFNIDSSGLLTNSIALEIGDYALNISVWDLFGNMRSRVIKVHVIPEPTPTTFTSTTTTLSETTTHSITTTSTTPSTTTTLPPVDPTMLLLIGIGGGGVAIIIIVIVIRKMRS
jgi:hypothetical protein